MRPAHFHLFSRYSPNRAFEIRLLPLSVPKLARPDKQQRHQPQCQSCKAARQTLLYLFVKQLFSERSARKPSADRCQNSFENRSPAIQRRTVAIPVRPKKRRRANTTRRGASTFPPSSIVASEFATRTGSWIRTRISRDTAQLWSLQGNFSLRSKDDRSAVERAIRLLAMCSTSCRYRACVWWRKEHRHGRPKLIRRMHEP
jgi:hypothetical protein